MEISPARFLFFLCSYRQVVVHSGARPLHALCVLSEVSGHQTYISHVNLSIRLSVGAGYVANNGNDDPTINMQVIICACFAFNRPCLGACSVVAQSKTRCVPCETNGRVFPACKTYECLIDCVGSSIRVNAEGFTVVAVVEYVNVDADAVTLSDRDLGRSHRCHYNVMLPPRIRFHKRIVVVVTRDNCIWQVTDTVAARLVLTLPSLNVFADVVAPVASARRKAIITQVACTRQNACLEHIISEVVMIDCVAPNSDSDSDEVASHIVAAYEISSGFQADAYI